MAAVGLHEVLREWGRIGTIGFGGPPAHVALLRELCVERRGWIDAREFEDANAVTGLLPGPASTQLAILCAERVAGRRGAVVGGLAFILPGLVLLLALAAVTLQDAPPDWVRGLSAGAGAAVVAVVARAGFDLAGPASATGRVPRWCAPPRTWPPARPRRSRSAPGWCWHCWAADLRSSRCAAACPARRGPPCTPGPRCWCSPRRAPASFPRWPGRR